MRKFNVNVNGKEYFVEVEEVGVEEKAYVAPKAQPIAAKQEVKAAPVAAPQGGTELKAPMPGLILDFKVANGTAVKKGDAVLVLEAMKMENDIAATADGVVTFVAKKGDNVNTGDILAYIK